MQALVDDAQIELNLDKEGDTTMFMLDVPPVPPGAAPAIMLAQANQAKPGDLKKERAIGVCHAVPNYGSLPPIDLRGEYGLSPDATALTYFLLYENRKISGPTKVTIIRNTEHGKLVDEGNGVDFRYEPTPGYIGKDRATMLVEIGDYKVKVEYFFQAVNRALGNDWEKDLCGKRGYNWKISRVSDANQLIAGATGVSDRGQFQRPGSVLTFQHSYSSDRGQF